MSNIEFSLISAIAYIIIYIVLFFVASIIAKLCDPIDYFGNTFPELRKESPIQRKLYEACLKTNVTHIKKLLADGAHLNSYCIALACLQPYTKPTAIWLLRDMQCPYGSQTLKFLSNDRYYYHYYVRLSGIKSTRNFIDIYCYIKQFYKMHPALDIKNFEEVLLAKFVSIDHPTRDDICSENDGLSIVTYPVRIKNYYLHA